MTTTAVEAPEPDPTNPVAVAVVTEAERILMEAAANHYGRTVGEYRHGLLAESPDMPEMLVANLCYYFGKHLLNYEWPLPPGTLSL